MEVKVEDVNPDEVKRIRKKGLDPSITKIIDEFIQSQNQAIKLTFGETKDALSVYYRIRTSYKSKIIVVKKRNILLIKKV